MKEVWIEDLEYSNYLIHDEEVGLPKKVKVINLDKRRPWTKKSKMWRCSDKLERSEIPDKVLYDWVATKFIDLEEFIELSDYLSRIKLVREVKNLWS